MNRRDFLEGGAAATLVGLSQDAVAAFTSTRLSVQVRGTGPDVILIPGLTNGRGVWEGTVRAIPGYRYHLVQVAGFAGEAARGNASGKVVSGVAEEIARYIAAEGLKRPAVIGHSMGGTIAMMIAARHPALIGRAMAVDILPAPASGFGFGADVRPFADALFNELTGSAEGRRLLDNLIGTFGGSGVRSSRSDSAVVASATHELATLDLTPELSSIRAPFTVVYAVPSQQQDAAAIDRMYARSYAAVKGVRLRRVPGSGHMVMYDQPAKFYAEVRGFLTA